MHKKWLFFICLLCVNFQIAWAQKLSIDVRNKASLQKGAQIFMNYCSGCHSLKYLRYDSMAEGLGLTDFNGQVDKILLRNNLVFTQALISDPIRIALPPEDAKQWFGTVPPDLSLIAREKGIDWLYTYLKSFYNDDSKPFGTNNLLVPDVAMPNILEPLMGKMNLVQNNEDHSRYLTLVQKGELSERQFDDVLHDLITFLSYVGEPVQSFRNSLGMYVLGFLFVFLLLAINLKRVYWRK